MKSSIRSINFFIDKAIKIVLSSTILLSTIFIPQANCLSPEFRTKMADFRELFKAVAICNFIEKNQNLNSVKDVLDKTSSIDSNFENIQYSLTLPYDMIMEIPGEGLAARYFDPTKANVITPYSDVTNLSTKIITKKLHRQIIHRIKALPFVESSFAQAKTSPLLRGAIAELSEPLPENSPTHKKKVNVSLVFLSKPDNPEYIVEPLGIESIAGSLKKEFDDKVEIHGTVAHKYNNIEDVIQKIINEKPDILALSLFFNTLEDLDKIMCYISKIPRGERPMIILGNVVATHNAELLLKRYPSVIVCHGDGELPVIGLVKYFTSETTLSQIPSISYKKSNGTITRTRIEEFVPAVPHRFMLQDIIDSKGKVYIETSRGCPFNCSFCERRCFFGHKRIEKPLQDLLEEIILLNKKGFKMMDAIDEDFISGDPQRAIDLAKAILDLKSRGVIDNDMTLVGSISVRAVYDAKAPNAINDKKAEALSLLHEAGFVRCFIGIESGSPIQLRRYGKAQTVEEAKYAINILKEIGITIESGFIMFYPPMTLGEVKENIEFLRETGLVEYVSHIPTQLRPQINTHIQTELAAEGLIVEGSYDPNWLTFEYRYKDKKLADIVYYTKEFESTLNPISNILKRIYRSNNFQTLPPDIQQFILDCKRSINIMLCDLIYDLVICMENDDPSACKVLDKHNEKAIDFLEDLLKKGGKTGAFKYLENMKNVCEILLVKRAVLRFYAYDMFDAQTLGEITGLKEGRVAGILRSFIANTEIEEKQPGQYRTLDKFFELNLAIPADFPRPAKDVPKDLDVYDISRMFDTKELDSRTILLIRESLLSYVRSNQIEIDTNRINHSIKIAHKLYLNPSVTSKELCEEFNMSREDMVALYSSIRRIPVFQALFLKASSHSKFVDTLMFLLNDRERIAKIITGKNRGPIEVDMQLSTKCQRNCVHCYNQGASYDSFPGSILDEKQIYDLLYQLQQNNVKMINYSGGKEPTLLFGNLLPGIMAYTHRIGLKFQLYSNGIEMDKSLQVALMDAERVRISLDAATPETYTRVSRISPKRGEEYYNRIISNIRAIVCMKKERHSSVRIGVSFVATPYNYKDILKFLDLGASLGVDFINISWDYLKKNQFNADELAEIERIIFEAESHIRGNKYGKCRITFAEIFTKQAKAGRYAEKLRMPDVCRASEIKIAIDPKGNVHPCCYYVEPGYFEQKYIFGNIANEPFQKILINGRQKGIDPNLCADCYDFDNYANIALDKLVRDTEFGIDVRQQPFLSLSEYGEMRYPTSGISTQSSMDSRIQKANINYIDSNEALYEKIFAESNFDTLVRVPIEVIETTGVENISDFLATLQAAPNGYVELYFMSGIGEVDESVYRKFGLQKKALPKDFKRTRENTVTLFPALKGEEIDQSTIASRLGSVNMTPENTILSPIGLQHDSAGVIRAAILGLKIMDIARQAKEGKPIDKDAVHISILNQLRDVFDPSDFQNFDLTPDDIVALATGNINNILTALKKLIKLLPITPINAEELGQIYEHVKAVITAA